MKIPLVSVVMSFLNAQTFMREGIESVFEQSFQDWELLLVDDGSSDTGTAIALQYAKDYPESVRYFQHTNHMNLGQAASRNVGVANAKGDYIAVLDADDLWLPRKLEQQLGILCEYPEAGMVFGCSEYWRSWTGNAQDVSKDVLVQAGMPLKALQAPPALLRMTLAGAQTPPPSDILLRTKAVIRVGGFEDAFTGMYGMYEDQAFLAKMYLNVPIFVSDVCWDKYRLHPGSFCAVQEREGREPIVRRFYLRWLDRYLATLKVADTEIRRSVRKALWASEHPVTARLAKHGFDIARQLKGIIGAAGESTD
jgi:glycosyltransferase involved in cell wall biosynthesis